MTNPAAASNRLALSPRDTPWPAGPTLCLPERNDKPGSHGGRDSGGTLQLCHISHVPRRGRSGASGWR